MDKQEFSDWEHRIAARAERLWQDAGAPEGGSERYLEQARMLIAIEENPGAGKLDPEEAAEPVVEEASLMRNLGEFPTLTDQGEEETYPDDDDDDDDEDADNEDADLGIGLGIGATVAPEDAEAVNLASGRDNEVRLSHGDAEDEILGSDGDASETGGVLPDDDRVEDDMPDISVADADITSDDSDSDNQEYGDEDAAEDEDINEDGLPDQPVFDR